MNYAQNQDTVFNNVDRIKTAAATYRIKLEELIKERLGGRVNETQMKAQLAEMVKEISVMLEIPLRTGTSLPNPAPWNYWNENLECKGGQRFSTCRKACVNSFEPDPYWCTHPRPPPPSWPLPPPPLYPPSPYYPPYHPGYPSYPYPPRPVPLPRPVRQPWRWPWQPRPRPYPIPLPPPPPPPRPVYRPRPRPRVRPRPRPRPRGNFNIARNIVVNGRRINIPKINIPKINFPKGFPFSKGSPFGKGFPFKANVARAYTTSGSSYGGNCGVPPLYGYDCGVASKQIIESQLKVARTHMDKAVKECRDTSLGGKIRCKVHTSIANTWCNNAQNQFRSKCNRRAPPPPPVYYPPPPPPVYYPPPPPPIYHHPPVNPYPCPPYCPIPPPVFVPPPVYVPPPTPNYPSDLTGNQIVRQSTTPVGVYAGRARAMRARAMKTRAMAARIRIRPRFSGLN